MPSSLSLEEAIGGGGIAKKHDLMPTMDDQSFWTTSRLAWFYSLLVALVPMLMGYDAGVMSGSIDEIQDDLDLSTTQAAWLVAIMNFVAAFGGFISGFLGDCLGRKGAIAISAVICLVGAAIMTFAYSYTTLMIGRVIIGLGCGCGFLQAPLYTSEIAPPEIRGRLVALTDMSVNFGILLGYVIAWLVEINVTDEDLNWRYMVGFGMIPPFLILLTLLLIPESPRWLILNGYNTAAKSVLELMSNSEAEAIDTFIGMQKSLEQEAGDGGYGAIFCANEIFVRHAAMLVMMAGLVQQFSGSETVVYYSPDILEAAGLASTDSQYAATVAVGVSKLLGDVLAALLLDQWGRRPIMLTSSIGVTLSTIFLGFALLFNATWPVVLFALCLYMALFSFGLGAVTFLICNELLPIKIRSKAVGIAVFLNRLLSAVTIVGFRSIASNTPIMAGLYLGLWSVGALSTYIFYYYYLPETANKTLEEVQSEMLAASHQRAKYDMID